MRVIIVARKPFSGSVVENAIKHGTGGINVNATRVSGPAWTRSTETIRTCEVASTVLPPRGGSPKDQARCQVEAGGGRWPANVILVHKGSCRIVGTKSVPTGVAVRERSGGKTIFSETKKPPMENMTYAGEDGMEEVQDWECTDGCPVKEMDRQSGHRTSGRLEPHHKRHVPRLGLGGVYGDDPGHPESASHGGETYGGDSGSASRFFKQFQNSSPKPPSKQP